MDRTEYLHLCQKVSMYVSAKREIPPELLVKYGEIVYYPHGYEMTFDKGKTKNTAILHDLKANSITYANLERVMKSENH